MLKFKAVKQIDLQDWDSLVKQTYGKPYSFQQQEGCQERGTHTIEIPFSSADEFMAESIPVEVNGEEMGVKFKVWLETDPKVHLDVLKDMWMVELFWHRNFYPDINEVANDLHKRGLVEAGVYQIKIDW